MVNQYHIKSVFKFLFLVSSLLAIFLIFSLFLFRMSKRQKNQTNQNIEEMNEYRYMEYNPQTKVKKAKGSIMVPIFPLKQDYQAYLEDDGKHVLFSKFDSTEYVCTGSCYCDSEERRLIASSTTVPIRKGLVTLVAAVSSTIAIHHARNYFKTECEKKLECSSTDKIQSLVNVCNRIDWDDDIDDDEYDEKIHDLNTKESGKPNYLCSGNCLPQDLLGEFNKYKPGPTERGYKTTDVETYERNVIKMQREVDAFKCEKLKFECLVPLRTREEYIPQDFMRNYLDPYCADQSSHKTCIWDKWGNEEDTGLTCCVGEDSMKEFVNPSVKCVIQSWN